MILELYHVHVDEDRTDVITINDRVTSRLIAVVWKDDKINAIRAMNRPVPDELRTISTGFRSVGVDESEFNRLYEYITEQPGWKLNGPSETMKLTSRREGIPNFLYPPNPSQS